MRLAALHDRADDAVARELVEGLIAYWKRPGCHLERLRATTSATTTMTATRDPQVGDGLGDRQVERADGRQLDEDLELELAGDLELRFWRRPG